MLLKSPVAQNSHQPQFVLEVSQVDSSFRGTASNNNNPMLTLSGHDIQALNATPIGQLPQQPSQSPFAESQLSQFGSF